MKNSFLIGIALYFFFPEIRGMETNSPKTITKDQQEQMKAYNILKELKFPIDIQEKYQEIVLTLEYLENKYQTPPLNSYSAPVRRKKKNSLTKRLHKLWKLDIP